MLVITRKAGQEIIIDQGDKPPIVVVVCEVRGNRVRVGVEADKAVRVLRSELIGGRDGKAA